VDSPVNLQELTIQLLLISCQWGWAQDVNVDDYPYIVEYVCGLFKRREQMRLAVERSVSYLFTNFVMPQNAGDFRLYIRRVVHDQPRRERADSGDISPRKRGESGPQKPCTDPAMMRRRSRAFWVSEARSPELLSPRSLASECEMHYQRIYEAIGRGEIEKIKWRGTLWINRSEADRYKTTITPRQQVRRMVSKLRESGNKKAAEALRKRIYRLRKSGASDGDILRTLSATRSR